MRTFKLMNVNNGYYSYKSPDGFALDEEGYETKKTVLFANPTSAEDARELHEVRAAGGGILKMGARYLVVVPEGYLDCEGTVSKKRRYMSLENATKVWNDYQGENEMGDQSALELFQEFQLVNVKFHGTEKLYTYKAPKDMLLEKGDYCIVDVKGDGFKVVQVVTPNFKIDTGTNGFKWICAKVDLSAYFALVETEKKIVGIMARAREARERKQRFEDLKDFMSPEDRAVFDSIIQGQKAIEA